MTSLRTEFRNKAKVLARIRALPQAVSTRVKAALAEQAENLVGGMREAAPDRTGTLKRSIVWEWGSELSRDATLNEYTVTVHVIPPGRFYAHLVEFGASPHVNLGIFAGTLNPGFHAEPFFFPVYRARKKQITARIKKAVKDAIAANFKGS